MSEPGRILAIDYGEKRIGLALTDPLLIFAYPYDTIPNDDDLFLKLRQILSEQAVIEIVLGMPIKEDGKAARMAEPILKFKKQLEDFSKLQVILWDESYSSVIAQKRVIESVSKKKKRRDKGLIDRNAAAVLLEEYLESR